MVTATLEQCSVELCGCSPKVRAQCGNHKAASTCCARPITRAYHTCGYTTRPCAARSSRKTHVRALEEGRSVCRRRILSPLVVGVVRGATTREYLLAAVGADFCFS